MLPPYGGDHKVRTALSNALPRMFFALSVPGMPFDDTEVERVFRDALIPYRRTCVQARSRRGMETAEELPAFGDSCRKNGIDPADALDALLIDPDCSCPAASARSGRAGRAG